MPVPEYDQKSKTGEADSITTERATASLKI